MHGQPLELSPAEKLILGLYGEDAQEGDCLWGGNMIAGYGRATAMGISMDEYNFAGDSLVRGGYLEALTDNTYRLTRKGLSAKNSGRKGVSVPF